VGTDFWGVSTLEQKIDVENSKIIAAQKQIMLASAEVK
jgi:hypothetical protein